MATRTDHEPLMRAWAVAQTGGPQHITEMRLPVPQPAPDEVLIRVRTVAVNHLDMFTMSGRNPKAPLSLPHVTGIDPSGVVVARGSEATSVELGRRVVAHPPIACSDCDFCAADQPDSCRKLRFIGVNRWGGHAEYAAVPERNAFVLEAGIGHAKATALAHSLPVAEQMLTRVGIREDDRVLVVGAAGAVGSAAVRLAKVAGARVVAGVGSAAGVPQARSAGADAVFDYTAQPDFASMVRQWAPSGVSVYVETASHPAVWEEALKTLDSRARVVVCGAHAGPTVQINNAWLFRSRVAIFGSSASSRRGMQRCLDLAAAGRVRPAIDSVRPISEIQNAFADLRSRRNAGKIVLIVDS